MFDPYWLGWNLVPGGDPIGDPVAAMAWRIAELAAAQLNR
jgi:hypothetical protein